jgi:hypothetical protein
VALAMVLLVCADGFDVRYILIGGFALVAGTE